jgi:2-C-methyl-D-erythritol 4-phosphate cytidylyltransferase
MKKVAQLAAILLAGGSGSRMQSRSRDKVLELLLGKPVFAYSVDAFRASQIFQTVCIVYRDLQQKATLQAYVEAQPSSGVQYLWVAGGQRRQDSVFNALNSPELEADYVFIHDCARPLIQSKTLIAMWAQLQQTRAVALAHPVVDSIKQKVAGKGTDALILRDLNRSNLWAMETPQAFAYDVIQRAYTQVFDSGKHITDDVAAAECIGLAVSLYNHQACNLKITHPSDLELVQFLLQQGGS